MLKIYLFGSGEAVAGDKALPGFPSHQAGLLLCYLLLNRRQAQPRERLAAVFWAEAPTATARKYLRNTLWRLKSCLGEAGLPGDRMLQVSADSVAIQPTEFWCDVAEFEQAVGNSVRTAPEALSELQVEELESAAALYRGDLLEGIYADWTLYDRERYRLLHSSIRQKLMLHHTAYGRFDVALAHGSRILAADPAREKIHRQMMRLYALSGDRNAALAQFQRCRQVLREELNLSPMRETLQLYRQIKNNEFDRENAVLKDDTPADPGVLKRLHTLQRLANRIHAELRTLEKLLNTDS